MQHFPEYLGLFGASLLSATVFPFQSEVILFAMLMAEHYQVWLLVLVASLGNILGSCVNWFLGRFIARSRTAHGSRSRALRAGTGGMADGLCS